MPTDADAASQQLLAEAHVSAPTLPSSSAVVGATLVNAARARHRHSSPRTTGKPNLGKLKRPSLPADEPLRNRMASRGDVFEIVLSPEKVTLKPAAIDHGGPHNVRLELELPNGKPRCTAILYDYDKTHGPQHHQCKRGTTSSPSEHYCAKHAEKRPAERCGEPVTVEDALDSTMRCHRKSSTETGNGPRCPVHAENPTHDQSIISHDVPSPQQRSRSRPRPDPSSISNHSASPKRLRGRPPKAKIPSPPTRPKRKRDPEVEDQQPSDLQRRPGGIPVRKRSKQGTTAHNDAAVELHSPAQPDVLDSSHTSPSPSPVSSAGKNQEIRAKKNKNRTKRSKVSKRPQSPEEDPSEADVNHSDDENMEVPQGDERIENDDDNDVEEPERESKGKAAPGSIHEIFRFLDLEERPGKCQTEAGSNIKRACKRASELVCSEDATIDEITEALKSVRSSLRAIDLGVDVPEEDRRDFKGDAYGYIFRALARFLQDVSFLLHDLYPLPSDSLYAMRTLSSLTKAIILFKDTIAAWNITLSQRYKGDRVIKDVDSYFIAPLRELEKKYAVRLSRLRDEHARRQQQQELEQRIKEDQYEESKRKDAEARKGARLDRWQYLHVIRLMCEPDEFRRGSLQITKLEDLEETDANGVRYERLAVFRPRSTPPLYWASSATKLKVWDQEEETVLLDSLQEFAGPDVFVRIFKTHCGRDVKLRRFRVVDIVAKADWIRSAFLKMHQEKGWEVPEWIMQLQVLI